ncbi:MAG TPA: DUF1080 domain-containing protein [Bacteroidales bacterium]|nr:DUF1080 domain-containing protein [Bacteroidales bacterium]HPF03735.1 DUF1080 domain-containing protein [Bacteroidales bacterium]HPJ60376.1 DUF1080 domain-containing protein [Bacteroidales bacterium]HPR12592.1 DUF1080 domain-containing protein [Bacteroidales bacterium]HRW86727.1 DUF1080 domain-containing protein [Bacteroidales bacterium]
MNVLTILFLLLNNFLQQDIQDRQSLFDGESLDGWLVIDAVGHGRVSVDEECIIIEKGEEITGVKWTGELPKMDYEVHLEAKRIDGSDFFCGLTFPVEESFLTLVLGGWGGSVTGLSCIDSYDAAENETYGMWEFEQNKWYSVRLSVTKEKIEAWIDDNKIVDFVQGQSHLSLRWEVDISKPFGITTYKTTGAIRKITLINKNR